MKHCDHELTKSYQYKTQLLTRNNLKFLKDFQFGEKN